MITLEFKIRPQQKHLPLFRPERKWENKKQRKEKSLSIVTYCPPSPPLRYSPAGDDRLRHRLDPMLTTHAGLHTCLLREGICKDKDNDNDRVHRQLHLAINANSFRRHNYFWGEGICEFSTIPNFDQPLNLHTEHFWFQVMRRKS